MRSAVLWIVRIILAYIFFDWFKLRYNTNNKLVPVGMVNIDIGTRTVTRASFGCSAEDIHDGDVVPMKIKLEYSDPETEESTTEE